MELARLVIELVCSNSILLCTVCWLKLSPQLTLGPRHHGVYCGAVQESTYGREIQDHMSKEIVKAEVGSKHHGQEEVNINGSLKDISQTHVTAFFLKLAQSIRRWRIISQSSWFPPRRRRVEWALICGLDLFAVLMMKLSWLA